MKYLITESRIYSTFKKFIDSEIEQGNIEVIKSKNGMIYLVDSDVNCYLALYPNKTLMIQEIMYDLIKDFFPFEPSELLKLIEKYVSELFNVEGVDGYFYFKTKK